MIYDFSRLISKYSNDIEVVKMQKGQYVNGRFVPSETVTGRIRGAILPIKTEKIYQSGGTLISSDRQLYTKVSLGENLSSLKIRYKEKEFKVEEDTNYSDYAGVYVYLLRRMDTFDKST